MNSNNLNSTQSNRFNTHIKTVKNNLHIKFIKYVDLFCIFWLILKKKLRIHNFKSYIQLINQLNVVLNYRKKDNNFKNKDNYIEYIINSSWSNVIDRFTFNINNKFKIKERKFKQLETLSENDFNNCTISLGREPYGLYSVIKSCVCKYKYNKINVDNNNYNKNININIELENLYKNWILNKNYECENCNDSNEKIPLVGIVTPFVLEKHEEYISVNQNLLNNHINKNKKQKLDNENKYNNNFKINKELYSGHKYPLESYLYSEYRTDDITGDQILYDENYNENIKYSYWLSDLIFELVCLVLDDSKNGYDVSEEIILLVEIIKENIGYKNQEQLVDNNTNNNNDNDSKETTKCNGSISNRDYLFDSFILDKLLVENKELLMKVNKLKPFPTLYWLIDKELITKVSKLEGKGLIKQIEGFIDIKIDDYNKLNNNNNIDNYLQNGQLLLQKEDKSKEKEKESKSKLQLQLEGENKHEVNKKEKEIESEGESKSKSQEEDIIQLLFKDNLFYILKRFRFTHPVLIELLYNIIFNSNIYSKNIKIKKGYLDEYLYMRSREFNENIKKNIEYNKIFKGLSILNTTRTQGISGNKDFLHIKCLHTHLAFDIAEGSLIGSIVSKLIL